MADVLLVLLLASCIFEDARPIVHAAASTAPVVSDVLGADAAIDAGATPSLVQAVIEGAPGAVLVSVDRAWTQDLVDRHLALEVTTVARNRLVLAAPPGSPPPTLATLDAAPCVVVGEPGSVPLGRYTADALTRLDRRLLISDRGLTTTDAVAAVAAVHAGTCPVGVLYGTDAVAPMVVPGDALPDAAQPTITVQVVLLDPSGRALADRLRDPAAWVRHGFLPP